jgi:hypothetical protein
MVAIITEENGNVYYEIGLGSKDGHHAHSVQIMLILIYSTDTIKELA